MITYHDLRALNNTKLFFMVMRTNVILKVLEGVLNINLLCCNVINKIVVGRKDESIMIVNVTFNIFLLLFPVSSIA